ncbi:MAG: hypothetical protein OJF55_001625 [Rhodanobacteraceae bacterium]|jgi:hypothetical protein|nr:MAG: hypothetical protein OJF55_001625 [Rhodanobacteraceae bacterium]
MATAPNHQELIAALGAWLTPVRRLPPPWLRALAWLLVVAAIAAGLLAHFGDASMLERFTAVPERAWGFAGAALTAVGAACAALTLGVPGRSRAWAWLALPGALLWIGASGFGCLRDWFAPVTSIASTAAPPANCLVFIVLASIPLSALMVWLLRRACPLRPVLTAMLVGLASAAAAAVLLAIFHPYDAAATDLLVHGLAVVIVVAANAALGNRLLSPHPM